MPTAKFRKHGVGSGGGSGGRLLLVHSPRGVSRICAVVWPGVMGPVISGVLLLMTLVAASKASCADFAGDWIGVVETKAARIGIYLSLIQRGQDVLGTISTGDDPSETPIENVQLGGDELSFDVHANSDRTVRFRLNLRDGAMSGQTSARDEVSKVRLAPATTIRVYPVIGRITAAPVLIHKIQPEYTGRAREAELEGTVALQADINPDGTVSPEHLRIIRGLGMGLDEKVIDAVKRWRFTPAYKHGKPVTATATITVRFRLF